MTSDERRSMWQVRIVAFKVSGKSSVTVWCATNNISVQSTNTWLKKIGLLKLTGSDDGRKQ